MKSLKEQIAEYRAERQIKGGYVVTYNGEVSGWTKGLGNAPGWMPGCVAYDESGSEWIASGGNHYDGAEQWISGEGVAA